MGKEVKVYSLELCSRCKMLKMWLNAKDIEFTEVDVDEDLEAREKLVQAERTSMPVLEIDGEFVEYDEYNDILEYVK